MLINLTMVIKFIQNEILRPEGGAQLFHQWERTDSISMEKYNFTQVVTLLSTTTKMQKHKKLNAAFLII